MDEKRLFLANLKAKKKKPNIVTSHIHSQGSSRLEFYSKGIG
jgi:hypothetical protein